MEEKKRVLPEGVGKKIVEALKQQTVPVEVMPQEEDVIQPQVFEIDEVAQKLNPQESPVEENDFEYTENMESSVFDAFETEQTEDEQLPQEQFLKQPEPIIQQPKPTFTEEVKTQQQQTEPAPQSDYEMPQNVEILKNLISQLPAGVTRPTGAQIIRQTMEAMGISMNSVLTEAQMVQESLGESTRECMNTVEEYKNNIRILEGKMKSYRKQAEQLGELISLFIITDKKR